jgi:hypothetical protein
LSCSFFTSRRFSSSLGRPGAPVRDLPPRRCVAKFSRIAMSPGFTAKPTPSADSTPRPML